MIYFDNSSTTPLAPEVREAMVPYQDSEYGNPSSIYRLGQSARVALEESRETIARFIGADAREIVFTSGGTEANNHAIKGVIFQRVLEGNAFQELSILSSPAEHHSVLGPIEFFSKLELTARMVSVDQFGSVRIREDDIRSKPTLLSAMLTNNETGARNDLAAISELRSRLSPETVFHVDAVQSLGKERMNLHDTSIDLLSISSHKINGPKGIGALYIRSGLKLEPALHGGAQERNRRAGTESVANTVGFAAAIKLLEKNWDKDRDQISRIGSLLRSKLERIDGVEFNSPPESLDIVNFSISVNSLDGETLLIKFDLAGVAVSNGSACTSGTAQPSHVLLAAGRGAQVAANSIRVSLGPQNTEQEVDQFIHTLKTILDR